MKTFLITLGLACVALVPQVHAHAWLAGVGDREALRAHLLAEWEAAQSRPPVSGQIAPPVQVAALGSAMGLAAAVMTSAANAPAQSQAFQRFPKLELRWDHDFLFVGGHGLPDHGMMVGITNWQQQVPLPQDYTGANAWRIPLHPVPAQVPQSLQGRFLRGAVALAVNGIPIFNAQNNRGEISQAIGELDQWGGHCGRADDYHYHAAPLHLQAVVGKGMPVAYALDGYPIYGLTEPEGAPPTGLDAFHGHESAALGYHYHASTAYPYVNGGFHGQVVEAGGQVDPQPRAQPLRGAGQPLRGAKITRYEAAADGRTRTLAYEVEGRPASIQYARLDNGAWKFDYATSDGRHEVETYSPRGPQGGGHEPPPRSAPAPAPPTPAPASNPAPAPAPSVPPGTFVLTSPVVAEGGNLPVDYTGDGRGISPPVAWAGAPAGTQSFAVIMDHRDPEGVMKWYWTVYDIPAAATGLPADNQAIGKLGTGFKGRPGYEPPHSKGPGPKAYVIHVYALSAAPHLPLSPGAVNRETLLAAIQGSILASADLQVISTRLGAAEDRSPPPRRD